MTKSSITQRELKRRLHYNPDTGVFTRLVFLNNATKNRPRVGWLATQGYLRTKLDGKAYLLHRLAFLYMTGSFPEDEVDHINHIRNDNRWKNLRNATHYENSHNQALRSINTSGCMGVHWHAINGYWVANIRPRMKFIHLGCFQDFETAVQARKQAEIKYGYHPNHGT